ncbi:MAG: hypothetical protein JWM11_5779 [Planctomycetaceae bacterium]|nr:hypothetical protein [Planctomycetaceae bacterium]
MQRPWTHRGKPGGVCFFDCLGKDPRHEDANLLMSYRKRLRNLGLPLLMKELHEQSARRRTFLLRIVYAVLLMFTVGLVNANVLLELNQRGVSMTSNLGLGRSFLQSILWVQFVGIYLFFPAMVCGVLTVEKERNTLGLLLITKLSPWTIILEKFASRIVPMLTFLLISLPMMSFMYALGGLEPTTLFFGLWFLLLSVLQIAAVAVLASSFFSGTVGAFLGTYALLGLLAAGPAFVDFVLFNQSIRQFLRVNAAETAQFFLLLESNSSLDSYFSIYFTNYLDGVFAPPLLLRFHFEANEYFGSTASGTGMHSVTQCLVGVLSGIPTLISVVLSLILARFFLVRRAFTPSSNPVLRLFKWLDRQFVWANQRYASGVVLVKESQVEPGLDPVAWRETAKRSLGQFRYLVRVFVALECPTLGLVILAATGPKGNTASSEPVSALIFFLWIVSVVLIAVTSSNLIAGERSRQTLDVLLTAPITGRELVLQKMRGVRRLMWVCAIPLLTCIAFQTWWRTQLNFDDYGSLSYGPDDRSLYQFAWIEYLITSLAGLAILFHMTLWLSFWLGMSRKSSSKAILTTLGVLVGWCALPMMFTLAILMWFYPSGPPDPQTSMFLWFLDSPAFLVVYSEFQSLRRMTPIPFLPVIINSLIYGCCYFGIRQHVLSQADACLSRIGPEKSK